VPAGINPLTRGYGCVRGYVVPMGSGCGHTIVPVAGNGCGRGCGFQLAGAGLLKIYTQKMCPLPSLFGGGVKI
jgi:hypothetical protein